MTHTHTHTPHTHTHTHTHTHRERESEGGCEGGRKGGREGWCDGGIEGVRARGEIEREDTLFKNVIIFSQPLRERHHQLQHKPSNVKLKTQESLIYEENCDETE